MLVSSPTSRSARTGPASRGGASSPARRASSSCSRRRGACSAAVQPVPGPARRARGSSSTRSARGRRAIAGLEAGDAIRVTGPLGKGFDLDVARPLLVGGGIGIAPIPYLSERLGEPPALLGFRTAHHAEAAALVPNAPRSCSTRRSSPTPCPPIRRRARLRPGADARRDRALVPGRSSRGRRPWPAATAPAMAASSSAAAYARLCVEGPSCGGPRGRA